ncbi:MAG: amino acid ABC transporter permease [Candidatus Eiseniibacteriota bacterium]
MPADARAATAAPPRMSVGPLAWMRVNLFGSVKSTILTVLAVALIVSALPPLVRWAFVDAVWGAVGPDVCRAADGACWAFIHEKYRLILFGRYPYAEQWRPFAGILLMIAMIAVSCNRRFWRAWLGAFWVVGLAVFFALQWGGFLGLPYVATNYWGGLTLTLILSVVGIVVAFPLGILLALGRRSRMPVMRAFSVVYIEIIRGVPLVSLLFMASFMLPLFLPVGVNIDAILRAQIAIILFTSAYLAEVIRGGLQAIPRGQYEAAEALGLSFALRMRKIILPQAIRTVIPPIVNSFISLFKDTSLVAIVSLTDLMLATRQAIADPNWRAYFIEGYIFIALIYFAFCFFMSKYSQYLERRLRTGHYRREDMA